MKFLFLLLFSFIFWGQNLFGDFEVFLSDFISVSQHKNPDKTMRLEIAMEKSKPGIPAYMVRTATGNGETIQVSNYQETDLRDALSSTREIVTDSDGNRSITQNGSILGGASSGGGGGCLLTNRK